MSSRAPRTIPQGYKTLLDFLPLVAFFLGFKLGDIMLATALIIAATLVSLIITYAIERKIARNPLISGVLVTVFGGLTLWLNDDLFIKMKPTILNCLFATILLGGAYLFKKGLLKFLLEMAFDMPDEGWRQLSVRWGFFFLFLAALNEYIWRNYPTEFWVNFKVFGMLVCTIIFSMAQIPLIKRYSKNR